MSKQAHTYHITVRGALSTWTGKVSAYDRAHAVQQVKWSHGVTADRVSAVKVCSC